MSRILVADDSPQALRLAEQILTSGGLEVVSVTDGAIALRRLADVNPDILITDVYLPTKNGFDLARFLRSQPQYNHIRVIFAAAPIDQFNEQDAKNAGADVILRKPFEASALLGAVHGREAVPERWVAALLACRSEKGYTAHPRAEEFWPVDALELAEAVLIQHPTPQPPPRNGEGEPEE